MLEHAQQLSKIGNWSINLIENSVLWSRQMFELFQLPEQKGPLSYEEMLETIHQDDRGLFKDSFSSCAHNAHQFKLRFRICFNDHATWVEARGQAPR